MDPAYPLFWFSGTGSRICKTDADNVEIIHTNAGEFGYYSAIGHVDFYINGGFQQNGCSSTLCSHDRAHQIFAESINSDYDFCGRQCSSLMNIGSCNGPLMIMGGLKNKKTSYGYAYIETNSEPLFLIRSVSLKTNLN